MWGVAGTFLLLEIECGEKCWEGKQGHIGNHGPGFDAFIYIYNVFSKVEPRKGRKIVTNDNTTHILSY
jgi:hypothetical protein